MVNKLLAVSKNISCDINIGDYVQALAASQFFDHIDGFIEREELQSYSGVECRMIMNGWYMHQPSQWPPSDKIKPLFVAFHLNSMVLDSLLSGGNIDYFNDHQPIGCRDYHTVYQLQSKGINAYFSGCLTLTLGCTYKQEKSDGKCYFVDPYYKVTKRDIIWKLKATFAFLRHPVSTFNVMKKRHLEHKLTLGEILDQAWFYKTYTDIFDKNLVLNAEYIYHELPFYGEELMTNDERLAYAGKLIKMYSSAALVVTSRIHCALPCTGMEVPVIYIQNKQQPENSYCRLEGLRELFNVIDSDCTKLIPRFDIKGKISTTNFPPIKLDYRPIADKLIAICKSFVNG